MNKKYKPVIAVAVLVILVAILGIVTHVVMKYIPSSEKMDLNEYYGEMADGEWISSAISFIWILFM